MHQSSTREGRAETPFSTYNKVEMKMVLGGKEAFSSSDGRRIPQNKKGTGGGGKAKKGRGKRAAATVYRWRCILTLWVDDKRLEARGVPATDRGGKLLKERRGKSGIPKHFQKHKVSSRKTST